MFKIEIGGLGGGILAKPYSTQAHAHHKSRHRSLGARVAAEGDAMQRYDYSTVGPQG